MKILWLVYVIAAVLLWSATDLLFKAGVHKEKENYTGLKFSISVGLVFFVVALFFLIVRDEPFSIWESAIRFWPMTVFGIIYVIVSAFSFKGFVYNEVMVESPVEGISGGVSVVLLIIVYLLLAGYIKINEGPAQTDIHDEGALELEKIYVSKEVQENGIGSYMMEQTVVIAKQKEKKYIWLGVWEKNDKAISFYQKHGFYKIGTHEFVIGEDIQTDYIMRRDL